MQRAIVIASALIGLGISSPGPARAAEAKQTPPYFASIAAAKARMRTGPARTYPSSWLYQRPELPVRVVAVFKEWRKIEDPDGTQGWMQANLLSSNRTAMVRGAQPIAMRDSPRDTGALEWRAAPGVIGRISQCASGWCRLNVKGQAGFVPQAALWGVAPGETLP